jgi:hypothetical protein
MSIYPLDNKARDMRVFREKATTVDRLAVSREVQQALGAWIRGLVSIDNPGVLIGGLALGFYSKPRYTSDIDILFLSTDKVPKNVEGFRRHRHSAFEDVVNNVEVEVCTPSSINVPVSLAQRVSRTSVDHGGLRVASREGLIALKLFGADDRRRELQDLADIVGLLDTAEVVDMSEWGLSEKHRAQLEICRSKLQK